MSHHLTPLAALDPIVAAAAAAADDWAAASAADRAALLRALALGLREAREPLVALANEETHLGTARLQGEVERTAFQLEAFALRVEAGDAFAHVDDPAVAGAPPVGHPPLLRVHVPVGPVAMFSASNFPFAFSVLGGDTASALAAGCPVVVKAHSGHPRLSRAVYAIAAQVIQARGLPAGLLALVEGRGTEIGAALVQHPGIAAVAFTGSFQGGLALQRLAQARPVPIPFYGELGSVNPVVALPSALRSHGAALAETLAQSIVMGCGQFCTSPGILIVLEEGATESFLDALSARLGGLDPHEMLTTGMRSHFDAGVSRWAGHAAVKPLLTVRAPAGPGPRPFLAETSAAAFIADAALREEVFGPATLVVRAKDLDEAIEALRAVGGSLTVTLWGAEDDTPDHRRLARVAAQVAGRVLFDGVPTGVAVSAGQQHGGPWPSSTQPFTTSVGHAALWRFLRPVALQSPPAWLSARQGRPC